MCLLQRLSRVVVADKYPINEDADTLVGDDDDCGDDCGDDNNDDDRCGSKASEDTLS